MIYLTLPQFYANHKMIVKLEKFNKDHPDYFKSPISFYATTGNFPYVYWNGGFNNCNGDGALYSDFINCSSLTEVPLRFNCSNICLTEVDYKNTLANLILSLNDNGSNTIELIDLNLYEYLHNKYPYYKFVFSREAEYYMPITPDFLNKIIDSGAFKYVSIPESKATDLEFIKQINNRKILEVPFNCSCEMKCPHYQECKKQSHVNQYNFLSYNKYMSCAKKPAYNYIKPLLTYDDIITKYLPLGINHFTLGEAQCDKLELVHVIIDTFVKDEYKYPCLADIYGGLYA